MTEEMLCPCGCGWAWCDACQQFYPPDSAHARSAQNGVHKPTVSEETR